MGLAPPAGWEEASQWGRKPEGSNPFVSQRFHPGTDPEAFYRQEEKVSD